MDALNCPFTVRLADEQIEENLFHRLDEETYNNQTRYGFHSTVNLMLRFSF